MQVSYLCKFTTLSPNYNYAYMQIRDNNDTCTILFKIFEKCSIFVINSYSNNLVAVILYLPVAYKLYKLQTIPLSFFPKTCLVEHLFAKQTESDRWGMALVHLLPFQLLPDSQYKTCMWCNTVQWGLFKMIQFS